MIIQANRTRNHYDSKEVLNCDIECGLHIVYYEEIHVISGGVFHVQYGADAYM